MPYVFSVFYHGLFNSQIIKKNMNSIQDLIEFARIDTTSAKGRGEEGAKFIKDYMESHGIEARLIRHRSKNIRIWGDQRWSQ